MEKLNLQQFAAPGLTTALRADTFGNLQLNAGVFLKDFTIEGTGAPTSAGALKTAIVAAIAAGDSLGATSGGGNFNVTRARRTPDIDGMRNPFVGSEFVDSSDAYLASNLVEITPENLALALGAATVTTSGNVTTVTINTAYQDSDYLENLVWAGDLSDGRLVCIVLYNALNTADLQFTFTDKGEGKLAVEFHAHQAAVDDYDEAPAKVIFFDVAT